MGVHLVSSAFEKLVPSAVPWLKKEEDKAGLGFRWGRGVGGGGGQKQWTVLKNTSKRQCWNIIANSSVEA